MTTNKKNFLKRFPFIIVTIISMVLIIATIIFYHKKKTVITPTINVPLSAIQKSDMDIGVYTDNIQNKNSAAPAPSVTVSSQVVAPSACTLQLVISSRTPPSNNGSYTVTVTNLGKTTCANASLSLYYDPNETYISSIPAATSSGYYWVFGDLTYQETKTIALTTDIQAAGVSTPLQGCLSADNGNDACTTTGATPITFPSVITTNITSSTTKIPTSDNQEVGVWEWTDVESMSSADMQSIVQKASQNGFNVIYLTIDHYLDLYYENNSTQRTQDVAEYSSTLESFVSLASKYGIAVDAEAGWRDWGETAQRQKAVDVLSYVAQFNASEPVKIRGMQYDIESYLLPQYTNNQATILTDYVGLADILQKQASAAGIPLTLVLPHFYDAVQQWTPEITYNGVTDYTFNQLLVILGRNPGNRMIIMAYRNTAEGDNGAIALAQTEVQTASAANNGTKIIVAQETGNVTPSYVTFYSTSRSDLFNQITAINSAFANQSAYAGIAIDYLDPFLALK